MCDRIYIFVCRGRRRMELSPWTRRGCVHDNFPTCDLVILVEKGEGSVGFARSKRFGDCDSLCRCRVTYSILGLLLVLSVCWDFLF